MLHGWDGVLGIVLLPTNTASEFYTKKLYFGLIWPHDLLPCLLWIIQMVFGKLQTGLDMCWLEQEDFAWSPSPREIDSNLEFLPFSNNCANSCCLLTKLFSYCPVAHPSLVQVYNFVPSVLRQLFGLALSGDFSESVRVNAHNLINIHESSSSLITSTLILVRFMLFFLSEFVLLLLSSTSSSYQYFPIFF